MYLDTEALASLLLVDNQSKVPEGNLLIGANRYEARLIRFHLHSKHALQNRN